jgi:hypothetical protein
VLKPGNLTALALVAIAWLVLGVVTLTTAQAVTPSHLHYAPNGNFGCSGQPGGWCPYAEAFNLGDVSSKSELDSLPSGVQGLVYVGTCKGANSTFKSTVNAFTTDAKLWGFYLTDEPYPSSCPPANLKAESDYVHATIPAAKTFIIMVNLSASSTPRYTPGYTPANSGLDLVGLDPYPCRMKSGCHYAWIARAVSAAEAAGWPAAQLVPVYQAFGGGSYISDTGDHYRVPDTAQENTIINTWDSNLPCPVFEFAYSFGQQESDTAITNDAELQTLYQQHNTDSPVCLR